MRRHLGWLLLPTLVACGGPDRVVDGARVTEDGWPERPAESQYRCPDGTFLSDESVGERRLITCRTRLNPVPRGFELAWHANGQFAMERQLDENGRPTSVVHYDETGRKVAEEEWVDGVRMRSVAWYPTGAVRSEELYVRDTGATQVRKLAPDGSVEAEGMLVDGQRDGLWTEWVDGALERSEYERGTRMGSVTRTYADGSIERGSYVEGARDGLWRRNDPNGLPMREERYVHGKLEGSWRAWHPNQQPKAQGTYSNDLRHGEWTTWHPSGEVESREHFLCGEAHGLQRTFHPNGLPASSGVSWNGERVGEWKNWNPQGVVTQVDEYPIPTGIDDLVELKSGKRQPDLPSACSTALDAPKQQESSD